MGESLMVAREKRATSSERSGFTVVFSCISYPEVSAGRTSWSGELTDGIEVQPDSCWYDAPVDSV